MASLAHIIIHHILYLCFRTNKSLCFGKNPGKSTYPVYYYAHAVHNTCVIAYSPPTYRHMHIYCQEEMGETNLVGSVYDLTPYGENGILQVGEYMYNTIIEC